MITGGYGHVGGGKTKVSHSGSEVTTSIDQKGSSRMASSDRPGGMDNIPSKFGSKKPADKTDMGKVAGIAHVNVKDRVGKVTKGIPSGDKGGGRK